MLINLNSIENEKELHRLLARSFGFPDYYGENWDAFWDAITGFVELPEEINFIGTAIFQRNMPEAFLNLKRCFKELNQEYPEMRCKVVWS